VHRAAVPQEILQESLALLQVHLQVVSPQESLALLQVHLQVVSPQESLALLQVHLQVADLHVSRQMLLLLDQVIIRLQFLHSILVYALPLFQLHGLLVSLV
jgi:hypothetical protein